MDKGIKNTLEGNSVDENKIENTSTISDTLPAGDSKERLVKETAHEKGSKLNALKSSIMSFFAKAGTKVAEKTENALEESIKFTKEQAFDIIKNDPDKFDVYNNLLSDTKKDVEFDGQNLVKPKKTPEEIAKGKLMAEKYIEFNQRDPKAKYVRWNDSKGKWTASYTEAQNKQASGYKI